MPQTLSTEALKDMLSEDLEYVYPVLLDIDHPEANQVYHFCNNGEDIVYENTTYQAFPFKPKLGGDNNQKAQLQISNVDGTVITVLRESIKAVKVTMRIIHVQSDYSGSNITSDNLEYGPMEFVEKDYSADVNSITITLGQPENFLNQKFPRWKFTPSTAPGMFE